MDIYFAVNDSLIEKHSMPERFQEAGTFKWKLSANTILANIISNSAGKVHDVVNGLVKEPFAICKARVNDLDVIEALRAAVVGDVVHIEVAVFELTWINKVNWLNKMTINNQKCIHNWTLDGHNAGETFCTKCGE
jgi:hypothetical protein